MSFDDEFDALAARRRKYLDGVDANEGEIDLDIFEDFYPDRAHFIFELLQNAEDACAKTATFTVTPERCLFEHDGEPFTMEDIRRITGIHNSAKDKKPDKIGQFGIGFKSVFAYTRSPEIHFGKFAFKITRLVLPERVNLAHDRGNSTRFVLPFNHPKKPAPYAEIKAALDSLPETTLLFLSKLRSVSWRVGDAAPVELGRVPHPDYHVEVRKKIDRKVAASSHFLLLDKPVKGLKKKRLAVAFPLEFLQKARRFDRKKRLAEQMRIVPANPGRVAVYFPAEKETSGLRFHLHAPFVPELSRASVKATDANEPLFQQLASLTAVSLPKIRKLDLLNAGFLEVLPNSQDDLGRYECIREAIIDAMTHRRLTPTHSGKHAPASRLLQARASLKELLSEKDVAFLLGCSGDAKQTPKWAIGVTQKNSRIDRFLEGLSIRNWNVTELAERLIACTVDGAPQTLAEPFKEWLRDKPPEWHQQLYALLYDHLPRDGYRWLDGLKPCRIVRLGDGPPERELYGIGKGCYFPSDSIEHDEEMPRVARAVYESGQYEQQQKSARQFLEAIGVRPAGEAEQVEAVLKRRYRSDFLDPGEQDLERFVALVEDDPRQARIFADYFIFECADGLWCQPCQVFLDNPFQDTGLSAYYEILGVDAPRSALAPKYENCEVGIERLAKFAKAVGAQTALQVSQRRCDSNPSSAHLRSGDFIKHNNDSYGYVDRDFDITEFKKLTALQSVAASRLIWLTMVKIVKPEELTASYQRNNYSKQCQAPSKLVHRLIEAEWVPQKDGIFVRPKDASRALLPEGFPFHEGYAWLGKVHFEEANRHAVEEPQANEANAQSMGFRDARSLELGRAIAALLPQGELERLLDELRASQPHELPEHESHNPERRAERVRAGAAETPERTAERRPRSVFPDDWAVKSEARQYLQAQYTNPDGKMICQVCKKPLPFKLGDGRWFFEAVRFLTALKKPHRQNYLALCPNHSAMFEHANGSKDSLRTMFLQMKEDELKVVLAQRDTTIYFTAVHIVDLRAAIDGEQAR